MADSSGLHRDATLLERARAIRPLLIEQSPIIDATGTITKPALDAIHDGRFLGLWLPKELGGSELAPCHALEVIEELSYADPSAGWVMMIGSACTGTSGAFLGEEAVQEMFGGGKISWVCGQGMRPGKAVRENGGYRISGVWGFGSGIRHTDYAHSLALVDGTEARLFKTPIARASLIENWDVMGLKGTGSIDYQMDEVFVPEAYSHIASTKKPLRGGIIYRIGMLAFAVIGHTGWALGIGRRLLDEVATYARTKAGQPGQIASLETFHAGFAKAEAKYRAGRALTFDVWGEIERWLEAGNEQLTTRHETMLRLALNHTTWVAEEVSAFVYAACGTTALRAGTIQRLYRDVHAGTQHVTVGPGAIAHCGRELAGLAKDETWQFLNLVAPKK